MAHTPQEKAQFRAHAETVAQTNINVSGLTPQEKQDFERQFGQSLDTLRSASQQDRNRLKLTIYANTLNPSLSGSSLNYENWIINNVTEAQILINTIDSSANLDEDDIYGSATMRCVRDIFGIDLPVPTTTTNPTAPATVAGAVSTTVNEEGETIYDLPAFMQDEEQLRGMLDQLGINGLRIENGKLIGRMELDTQDKLRKLEKYLDYVNYLETPGADAAGKVQRYKELLDDSTDYIWDKQYIIQKYMISMYKDLLEVGCTIRQTGENGEYAIVGMRSTPEIDALTSKYDEIVSGGYARTSIIEFVRIYGIVESSNNPRFHEQAVSREGLVLHILQNNNIVSSALNPEIQSVEALLLNKDEVQKQLETAIEGKAVGQEDPNYHHYQEAIWLYDFLKHEHYKQDDIQRDVFNQVNHYKNVFLKEHSFIDALSAEGIDPNDIDPNDDSFIAKAERVLGKNSPLLYLFGILLLVFKDTRQYGVMAIFGTLGAKIALGIAGDTAQEAGLTDTGNTVGDAFDIFNPINLRHKINYEDGYNRENYDPTLTALYDANDARRNDGEIVNATAVKHTNNAKIAFIFEKVMGDEDALATEFAAADTTTLVSVIGGTLGANPEVTDGIFDSRVPEIQQGEVTEDDIKVFIELLRTTNNGNDTTIGDLLYAEDIDKLGHLYDSSWFSQFTEAPSSVDPLIHDIFRGEWDQPSATREQRAELLKVAQAFETHLYSGLTDANWAISNTANASNPLPSLGDKLQKLGDLENFIIASSLDASTQANLTNLLLEYKGLLEKQDEFDAIKGSWYEVSAGNQVRFQTLTSWLRGQDQNETNLEQLRIKVGTDITQLEALLASLPAHAMYNDLKASIQEEINYLGVINWQIIEGLIANSDIDSVVDGSGLASQNINDTIGLGVVTGVATELHGALRSSIDASIETSVFGVNESDLRAAIIGAYQSTLDNSVTGINSSATITVNTWNSFRGAIQNSLAARLNGSPVSGIIGTIPPIGILPAADQVIINGAPDRATIDQITAQIQLQILARYFTTQETNLENIQKLRDAYLPEFTRIMTGGGSLTPEQQRLSDLIMRDYDALLADIEAKVKELADNYEGAAISTTITDLEISPTGTPPVLDSTNLDNFENVAQFLAAGSSNDAQITFLQNQVNRHFGSPNSLDGILVPSTQLQTDFEVKTAALRKYVEEGITGVAATPATPTTPAVPAILAQPSPLDFTAGISVLELNEKIVLANRIKTIVGSPTNILDGKITTLETELNRIATLADIEHEGVSLTSALTDDLATLNNIKIHFDSQGVLPTEDKYIVLLELIRIVGTASSALGNNYQTFKGQIQTATARGSSTIQIWPEIQTGTYEGETINTVEILNNI